MSVQIPIIRSEADEYQATIKINKAVLEMFRHGGGPVHIDLASSYNNMFSVEDISDVRIIRRYYFNDVFPEINKNARVAIAVGTHKQWTAKLSKDVDRFCAKYNAVVLVDHSSHYWGAYRVLPTIISSQQQHKSDLFDIDLLIHIGEEHGDYYTDFPLHQSKEVWRVSEDGEIRDTYGKLTNVFEMPEDYFFKTYSDMQPNAIPQRSYYDAFIAEAQDIYNKIPELPFSNIWIAQQIIPRFPSNACLELGLSNTMRAWTFFDFKEETYTLANTGCRGIDGMIPTLLGMSLTNPNKLHFAVMGDLTFFYSFNVLGNRHLGTNLRILLVNNGCGGEFNLYQHRASQIYHGNHEKINEFVAAGGHTGTKSRQLVKHYAEDLGIKYLAAETKEEFNKFLSEFLDEHDFSRSIIFEVFTNVEDESNALKQIRNLKIDPTAIIKGKIKRLLGRS